MTQLMRDVEKFLGGFELGNHIGITKLQRETQSWKDLFNKAQMIEILDRNETYAVMMKPEIFNSMREYIKILEGQLEAVQLDLLFARRGENMEWLTGEELKQNAMASFNERIDVIRELLDDQQ